MYQLQLPIDREYILRRVSQEQIMERYTGKEIRLRKKFRSPLRKDANPTCEFRYSRSGRLYLKDYSGAFWGDCFDVVMKLYPVDFWGALEIIAVDFNLKSGTVPARIMPEAYQPVLSHPAVIEVRLRAWAAADRNYWLSRFGINRAVLTRFGVYPLEKVWCEGNVVYSYSENDPAYGYRLAPGQWKIYFPFRRGDKPRFMGNTGLIQGYAQLPQSGDLLILTKSMKDVMVLSTLGIFSVAYQSESILPDAITIEALRQRFQTIYTLYDFDLAGIRMANRIKRAYDIRPLMLTNGRFGSPDYRGKDAAELVERFGADVVRIKAVEFLHRHYAGESLKVSPLALSPEHNMNVPF